MKKIKILTKKVNTSILYSTKKRKPLKWRKGDNDSTESPVAENGWTPDHHNMDHGGHGEK